MLKLYKYLRSQVAPSPDIDGYVTPVRFIFAEHATQYTAIPYSPIIRIETDTSLAKDKLIDFRPDGCTEINGQVRRAWPAFDLHGGAWELRLHTGIGWSPSSDSSTGWTIREPSLNPRIPPLRMGRFVRDSEWQTYFAAVRALASAIYQSILNSDIALDQTANRNPDPLENPSAFKIIPGLVGAAIRLQPAKSKYQLCISYLAISDRAGRTLKGLRLFGAAWRDDREANPVAPDNSDLFVDAMVSSIDPHFPVPLSVLSGAERLIAHRTQGKLALEALLSNWNSQSNPLLRPRDAARLADEVRYVVAELLRAVNALPSTLSLRRQIVPLPRLGRIGDVL